MLRHLISEIKEALFCLRAGRVTLRYPFEPAPAPKGYRGKPVLDTDLCTGCGACANACPSRTIHVRDEETHRLIEFDLTRCIHCGRCEEVCPDAAVVLSPEYELATTDKGDLFIRARFLLQRCERCGTVVGTKRQAAKLLEEVRTKVEGLRPEDVTWLRTCVPCRRRTAYTERELGREVVA